MVTWLAAKPPRDLGAISKENFSQSREILVTRPG
jgi:hypothetical protein